MSTLHFEDRLAAAVSLRENGEVEKARAMLIELQAERPDDASVNLQCAWAHDKLGLETEAVPFYERALEIGLEGPELESALLGLGSTHRALGEYEKAVSTLQRGVESFPGRRSIKVFLAMALYNNGQAKEACETLLRIISETTNDPEIIALKNAIDTYAADLDRSWA